VSRVGWDIGTAIGGVKFGLSCVRGAAEVGGVRLKAWVRCGWK